MFFPEHGIHYLVIGQGLLRWLQASQWYLNFWWIPSKGFRGCFLVNRPGRAWTLIYFFLVLGLVSKCKLKTCPYCTKTCPHWTCFGSNYLKNGVWLAVTLDKNFNFSKVLLSPKFNYNSISIEVKKKILYYIVYPTLE